MTDIIKVDAPARKPIFEGVQGENEARSIQFDVTAWVEELGAGAVTATAKRSKDSAPYPVTVTRDGNTVTWKPTSTDTAYEGVGAFQLEYTVDSVVAKTRVWSTIIAPSLVGAGDPPDPYDDWMADLREVAADALQSEQNAEGYAEDAEAWAVGQRGGVDVPSTDPTYENNAKYYAEQSLANQYGAFPVGTESGSIASFTDGADDIPVKSLKIGIEPKQAGSGTPSPSNVRPISGWTDAKVFVTGKNLLVEDDLVYGKFLKGVDGTEFEYPNSFCSGSFLRCLPSTNYRLSTGSTNRNASLFFYDANYNFISYFSLGAYDTYVRESPSNAAYMRVSLYNYGTTYNHDISVTYASESTGFVTYTGHTTPVPFGQTVYGGEVDVTSGVLTITHRIIDLGTLNWWQYNATPSGQGTHNIFAAILSGADEPDTSFIPVCSQYQGASTTTSNTGAWVKGNYTCCFLKDGDKRLYVRDDAHESDTRPDFKAYLDGVKFVYKLATPLATYQLTPTEVRTLLGDNNVWADTGDTDIEYRKDPTLALEELANAIVALGGNL